VLLMAQARRARVQGACSCGSSGLGDPKIGELAKENAAGAITMLPLDVNAPSPVVKEFVRRLQAGLRRQGLSGRSSRLYLRFGAADGHTRSTGACRTAPIARR
jgi:hypothetical protein